jgi:uncharacterized protein
VKKLLAFLGLVSLGLGILGVFLPLLPTTPFVLLSAALFARSSTRLNHWIRNHRIFGQLIKDYNDNKSIPLHAKVWSIALMWTSILFTTFTIASDKRWLQILLISIAIGVSIHIMRYKTKKKSN